MIRNLILLFSHICELLTVIYTVKDFYELRFRKNISVCLFILCVGFQFVNNALFLGNSVLVAVGALLFTFLILLVYKIKPLNSLVLSFLLYLLLALPELIVGVAMSIFSGNVPDFTQSDMISFALGTFTTKFLSCSIVVIIKSRKLRIDKAIRDNFRWVLLMPLSSFVIMLLFLTSCLRIEETAMRLMILFSSVLLCAANVAVFATIAKQNALIETKEKLFFAEKHIHRQILHYEELYKYRTEMQMFRHDSKNRLLSMMGILKNGDVEKAIQELQSNLDFIEEASKNFIDSGNPIIDAVLQSKLHDADQRGISLKISVKLSEKINIDELETGIIIGNALDNAIEAVEKADALQSREITFSMISSQGRISISVKNPVSENVDTSNLETSKDDRELHGFGINSIKAIARKYDGLTDFICENNFFYANINLANAENQTTNA